jgi:hypothetical protein
MILLLIASSALGQNVDSLDIGSPKTTETPVDTIIYEKPKAGFISNFLFQFDNRNERYYTTRARMNGVKIGFEFYRRYRTGFGFYGNSNFYRMRFPDAASNLAYTARLNYSTWFNEIVIFRSFRWELAPSMARGTGQILLQEYNSEPSIPELNKTDTISDIRLYDIGFNTQFKIFPWFGLGAGVGYRFLNLPDYPQLQGPFTDPYVDFKVKVFLGYAFKGIFNPSKIEAERNYYEQRSRLRWARFRKIFID